MVSPENQQPSDSGPTVEKVTHRSLSPFARIGLQARDAFDHVKRRGIGGGVGPADFPVNAHDFGECFDEFVGLLQDLPGFGDTDARISRGHVEQIAFIKRGHELAAEPHERPDSRRHER